MEPTREKSTCFSEPSPKPESDISSFCLHSSCIDRASPAGPMSQLWFKDTHEFQPLRTDLQTGVCRINLLRSFDVESNTSYALSYDRLTDLFQLVNSAQGSRPLGRIEADLEAVVYSPDDPKRTTIIAQSERVRVSIDHIARIVEIRPPDPVATRVEVRRRGKLIKQYKRTEMGRFLRGEEQLKLIPGDLILLGPYDGVNVMWRTSQDEWKITADPGTLASVGADHAAVVVGPEGGPPSSGWWTSKGIGWGVGLLVSKVTGSLSFVAQKLIGIGTGELASWGTDQYLPETTDWLKVAPLGTEIGFLLAGGNSKIFLIDGRARFGDGHQTITLAKGESTSYNGVAFSRPSRFEAHSLPTSLRRLIGGSAGRVEPVKPRIASFRFFEGPLNYPPEERSYTMRFSRSAVRAIFWEAQLDVPVRNQAIDFALEEVWYRPDGSVLTRLTRQVRVQAGAKAPRIRGGYGADFVYLGTFYQLGTYLVELRFDGQKLGSKTFDVVQ